MTTAKTRVTFAELEQWPDDGQRYELYDGEVRVVPAPMPLHQVVSVRMAGRFDAFARATGGLALPTPIDVVFNEYNAVQPDILLFQASRRHLISLDAVIRVPPDIVVEILSPSTARHDKSHKLKTYLRFGVPEYWIVDPRDATIEVLVAVMGEYQSAQVASRGQLVRSVHVPDLEIEIDDVFRQLAE